jgi:hypothetical protein
MVRYMKIPGLVRASTEVYAQVTSDRHPRPRAEVERFFAGMEIVPPYEGAEPAVTHLGVWAPKTRDWRTATVPTGGSARWAGQWPTAPSPASRWPTRSGG